MTKKKFEWGQRVALTPKGRAQLMKPWSQLRSDCGICLGAHGLSVRVVLEGQVTVGSYHRDFWRVER